MIKIRQTHKDGYRSGQWAELTSIQPSRDTDQDLWVVMFDDGKMDVWPSWDTSAGYQIKYAPRD